MLIIPTCRKSLHILFIFRGKRAYYFCRAWSAANLKMWWLQNLINLILLVCDLPFFLSALLKSILINNNKTFPLYFESVVVDNGENWSVGQRQLLCLGRIMLKHCKVLFMDEATASVDSQTDSVVQKIIREDFAACTIISIAHRIPTVMDCDRVLVMDAGLCFSLFFV